MAANIEIRKKLPQTWIPRDFEMAARLLVSLEEGRQQGVDKSSSTFKEAKAALEKAKAAGFLDTIPATSKKVTIYTDQQKS